MEKKKNITEKGKLLLLVINFYSIIFYVHGSDGNVERRQTEYHVLGYQKE